MTHQANGVSPRAPSTVRARCSAKIHAPRPSPRALTDPTSRPGGSVTHADGDVAPVTLRPHRKDRPFRAAHWRIDDNFTSNVAMDMTRPTTAFTGKSAVTGGGVLVVILGLFAHPGHQEVSRSVAPRNGRPLSAGGDRQGAHPDPRQSAMKSTWPASASTTRGAHGKDHGHISICR